ncbi:hypothetical protein JYU14_02515 [Simkania negevensis]|uniref:Uncharacterized protein n=1 Tax=Simkania negevensis TaxID=83561 RepID=A0ABS3AQD7_9BACT|nr:hypothetical protein [Simkania negevensis]
MKKLLLLSVVVLGSLSFSTTVDAAGPLCPLYPPFNCGTVIIIREAVEELQHHSDALNTLYVHLSSPANKTEPLKKGVGNAVQALLKHQKESSDLLQAHLRDLAEQN